MTWKVIRNMRSGWQRVKILATGTLVWEDTDNGDVSREHANWHLRWVIAGIHSYKWSWVRRHGRLACGCTRNPITHRLVLIAGACEQHGVDELRRKAHNALARPFPGDGPSTIDRNENEHEQETPR